jgi:uncharacterized membrane protein
MMEELLRFLHVIGATVLLGTGAGIAFFMVLAVRTRDAALIAHVANSVVVADMVFTAAAVIVQPVTGYLLARSVGWPLTEGWIALSLGLYVVTGLFWLPVVWIQMKLRDLAKTAAVIGAELPAEFDRFYRIWFACGFPAFFSVVAIIWLMLTRPALTFQ